MWIAKLKDKTLTQNDIQFSEIKHLVIGLGYVYNDTTIWLPDGMLDYRYGGSASSSLVSGKVNIDSYWIQGTFHSDFSKLIIRFYNNEDKITIEKE